MGENKNYKFVVCSVEVPVGNYCWIQEYSKDKIHCRYFDGWSKCSCVLGFENDPFIGLKSDNVGIKKGITCKMLSDIGDKKLMIKLLLLKERTIKRIKDIGRKIEAIERRKDMIEGERSLCRFD